MQPWAEGSVHSGGPVCLLCSSDREEGFNGMTITGPRLSVVLRLFVKDSPATQEVSVQ